MRVFLRDPLLCLYFQRLDCWTDDIAHALDFQEMEGVFELAAGTGAKDCEILLYSDAETSSPVNLAFKSEAAV